MCLKSCIVRPQQMYRFQAGQPGAAEFKKQNNQLHAGMCWHVLVCASTKCRKFEHVKVCTSIYWGILIHFKLISYRFIPFHTISYPYFLLPLHTKHENLRNLHTWYEVVCITSYQNTDFHRQVKYIPVYTGIYRYIQVYTGIYVCHLYY